jgi:antirestriction protein ArdC
LTTLKAYRGINPWLLMATAEEKGYRSPYWLTYKQTKERGGYVRAGEQGTLVVFWRHIQVTDKDGEKTIPFLRYSNVYNLEQTENVRLPKSLIPSEDEVVADKPVDYNPIEACEKIVAGYKTCPKVNHGFNRAFYSPVPDSISMPDQDQFNSMENYYATLFHEMAHSTGHESRLHRTNFISFFGSHEYGKEELVAEMTAAFLCAHAGIENSVIEVNASYVAAWKEKIQGDSRMVVMAAAAAQKAADYILDIKHDEPKIEEEKAQ